MKGWGSLELSGRVVWLVGFHKKADNPPEFRNALWHSTEELRTGPWT
jgi:hypothetical protein